MKRACVWWIVPLVIAALCMGCPNEPDNSGSGDTKVALTAGNAVTVAGTAITGMAVFTGVTGFSLTDDLNLVTNLTVTKDDFTVTDGAAISLVYAGYDEVKITVTFPENPSFTEPRGFTVGISPNSAVIKGTGTVTITQAARAKVELTAGSPINVGATAATATASFTGAAGLPLTAADFTVSTGGTITGVTVADGTANVTVTFAENTSEIDTKTYTVGIASTSVMITGDTTVVITQNRVPQPIVLSPATLYVTQDYQGANTTASWTTQAGNAQSSGGAITQTLVADPADAGGANKVGSYNGNGTGNRAVALNLAQIITGDVVVAEFDWYPGTYPGSGNNQKGPLYISLNETRSTSGTAHGNKIITFVNDQAGALKYRLGHFADGDDSLAGAVEMTGTTEKTKWYTVQVIIDFPASRVKQLTVTDKADGTVLFRTDELDITYTTASIATMRLFLHRTEGDGHTTYLDNVYVGNGSRP
jgi:hypothetical protein